MARVLEVAPGACASIKEGGWRKRLVAGLIRERALVDNGWLAERLHMGTRNAVSRSIRMCRERLKKDRATRRIAKTVGENVKLF